MTKKSVRRVYDFDELCELKVGTIILSHEWMPPITEHRDPIYGTKARKSDPKPRDAYFENSAWIVVPGNQALRLHGEYKTAPLDSWVFSGEVTVLPKRMKIGDIAGLTLNMYKDSVKS